MFKMPKIEINCIPSQLNLSDTKSGVASQLATLGQAPPESNGATIETMRGNPLFERGDVIDKVGLAQKKLAESAKAVSKSKFVRALNKQMNHPNKPKQ